MSKFAVIETGSKQYRVEPKQVIEVEKVTATDKKQHVTLDRVLLLHDGKDIKVGSPFVKGAKVLCAYLGDFRGPKVISFRFKRRKSTQRKRGHRQDYSRLQVKEIISG